MSAAAQSVRTRFAPSPTGYLHIGGARTALFAWAYARHFGGQFVLRVEDTDLERSTPEAVQAILDGMSWLGFTHDEGPFYQTQRMARYREVIEDMLAEGSAYHCYCTPAELDAMREEQRARGEKPRYDGRWRPENSAGQTPPAGVAPAVRFSNPLEGVVAWDDLVKGPIRIANAELDDLVIARSDGTPTYNFCVVVDDHDMRITHVIRGDDHVNNTPRQINILRALGAALPVYGHVPMIHGPDGLKLSKRHGAVSVLDYERQGFLPDAVVNYLARLGWSHGDDELVSRAQLIEWFDGSHLSQAPSQLDPEKMGWVNQHYLKASEDSELARLVAPRLRARGVDPDDTTVDLAGACALLKERCTTLEQIADEALMFYPPPAPLAAELAALLTPAARTVLTDFAEVCAATPWRREAIASAIKSFVAQHALKMPQLGVPLRVAVFGRRQTPGLDAVLAVLARDEAIRRLRSP